MPARLNLLKTLGLLALLLFLFIIPALTQDPYRLTVLILIFLGIVWATTLRLILTTGIVSFGQVGFMAIGAYTSGVLVMKLGWPFWAALPMAGVMAALAAAFFGYPALRVKGVYFFIVSFGFGEIVRLFFSYFYRKTFGGLSGLIGIPAPDTIHLFGLKIEFVSRVQSYYLFFLFMLLVLAVLYQIDRSRIGKNCTAIAQAESLAEAIGISPFKYKMLVFAIAGFFMGLSGSLYAHSFAVITPTDFTIGRSLLMLVFVVVGGQTRFSGPIVGAIFLTILGEYLSKLGAYYLIFFGLLLILAILFMPTGVVGVPKRVTGWLSRRRQLAREVSSGSS